MKGIFALSLILYCAVWARAFVPFSIPRSSSPSPAAPPSPCKTALQWEGRFSEWDHTSGTNNRYTISYDGVKRRKWVEEEQKSMRPGRRLFKFLVLFDEQVEYKIDLTYNRCSKIPIGPWRNFSIPPLALYEDEYQIGGPTGNLDVIEWSDRQPARKQETWIGGFTKTGCWPVFEIFTYDNGTTSAAFTTRFFDLTPGIKNMSVFEVPEMCKAATEEEPPIGTPSPDAPTDEGLGLWYKWVPGWFKKWFDQQKIDMGGLVPPSAAVPGPSTEASGRPTEETASDPGTASSPVPPRRSRNRYNTGKHTKDEADLGSWKNHRGGWGEWDVWSNWGQWNRWGK